MGINSWPSRTRLGCLAASATLFLVAVNRSIQSRDLIYDKNHLASFHATQYLFIFVSGMCFGLGTAPSLVAGFQVVFQTVQSSISRGTGLAWSRFAAATLAVVMIPSLLWTVSSLNVFIDSRQGLVVEADVLVVLMGLLTGSAWYALLERKAWVGILFSLCMGLMVIGSILSNAGW